MEDLLIALADRRSFPETRFFVARGIVGETWSTESAAAAALPDSVLALPVKEPGGEGGGERGGETTGGERRSGSDVAARFIGLRVIAVRPSMLCHAGRRSHNQELQILWDFHRHSQNRSALVPSLHCKTDVCRKLTCLLHMP